MNGWANAGILGISLLIITITFAPAYANNHITFQKTLDVEKTSLEESLTNVGNYKKVFPDYIRTVDVLEKSEDSMLTDIAMSVGMIPLNVQVEHNTISENIHQLSVVSGDLKGTQLTTKMFKTWGYDGTPEQGTIVQMDMSLQVSGLLALLGSIDEGLIHYILDSSLLRLQEVSGDSVENVEEKKTIPKKRR